jgi:hypothetical protein
MLSGCVEAKPSREILPANVKEALAACGGGMTLFDFLHHFDALFGFQLSKKTIRAMMHKPPYGVKSFLATIPGVRCDNGFLYYSADSEESKVGEAVSAQKSTKVQQKTKTKKTGGKKSKGKKGRGGSTAVMVEELEAGPDCWEALSI